MARPRISDLERLDLILLNLARIVPGYPLDLALLARLSALLEKRTVETVNDALRPLDLSYVLYHAMMIIHGSDGGVATPSELAELTGERPNNVTHICNQLETAGLIVRAPARSDRRRVQISLSAAGRRLLGRAQPLVWALWRRRFQDSGAKQLAQLPQLLRRQIHNLDAPAGAPR